MPDTFYTHVMWRVKRGMEAEFIEAWKALGDTFTALPNAPGPEPGILIQSESDPTLFYSFGPWYRREDIDAMRIHPSSQAAIRRVMQFCDEATPRNYRLIAKIGGASS